VLVIAKRVVSVPNLPGFNVAVNTMCPVPPGGKVGVVHAGTRRFFKVIGGPSVSRFHVELIQPAGAVNVKGQAAFTSPPKRISGGSKAISTTSFAEAGPEFV
jgi:hypothetical protein